MGEVRVRVASHELTSKLVELVTARAGGGGMEHGGTEDGAC